MDLQVLPYSAGAVAVHSEPFTLLAFAAAQPVMYADDPQGGRLYRSADTVTAAMDNCDRLRANALSPDDSTEFIRAVRKEHAT
ncbi:Scr1 family TA system antitoxin-like transcriptional regulator [Streptomyces bohaiensis]|uniref:Scr1 family TA system antitoxin-like transcriptional regulator n=1 Tax=Streptomyces bohaiensis TaxID=1431344 RepID=UPI003B7C977D